MSNWKQNFNWKTWVPLTLAIVLGLVAAFVASDLTRRPTASAVKQAPMLSVVVATRDIPAGAVLGAEDLSSIRVEASKGPSVGFDAPGPVVGRVTRSPAYAGQPIVEGQLAPMGAGAGLQAVLPRGMRAVTVEIDEMRGVAGYLMPGCRVDVVTTVQGKSETETVAKTVVQDIEVLAVGRPSAKAEGPGGPDAGDKGSAKSVTLAVTPEQAQAVELAARLGLPRLVLRGSGDRATVAEEGTTLAQLRGAAESPAAPTSLAAKPTLFGNVGSVMDAAFRPSSDAKAGGPRFVQMIRRGVVSLDEIEPTAVPSTRPAAKVAAVPPAETPTESFAPPALPTVITDLPTGPVFPN